MSWGRGYVTDIEYISHYSKQTSPTWLAAVCTLQNVAEIRSEPVYLELGCGQGLALNLLAASNPNAQFVGVDFSPAHIANAKRTAREAELHNVEFLELSFEQLASDVERIPEADIISVHGVYSWIGADQRSLLREIIRSRLKTGGVLYVSYNCAVGWASIAGVQKLLRDFNLANGGLSSTAHETIKLLKSFSDSGLRYFSDNPRLKEKLDALLSESNAYIAHEYLNEHFTPMYVQDVIKDMSECKLTFAGSARPSYNIDEYTIEDNLKGLMNWQSDQSLKECMKDMALNNNFRQDLFVRGISTDPQSILIDRLRSMNFILAKPAHEVQMEARVPRGILHMQDPVYSRALDIMRTGSLRLGAIEAEGVSLRATAIVLMETNWAEVAVSSTIDSRPAKALNRVLARRASGRHPHPYFACAKTGSAIVMGARDSWLLTTLLRNPTITPSQLITAERSLPQRQTDSNPGAKSTITEQADFERSVEEKAETWKSLGLL